ncbi:MAG: glutamate--tRNA ligase [Bacteroidales bacterium]|jgi:glutamyl-tRNA synthetase|nr:glutamate--tRNA ligase [Bacteroidales bacterium]MDD5046130.1 glutamate--tRNA ligase [Bacteroidales bacterium]MDY0353890.1 glutamate--tRNA ligase [Bacteroidales bacterium]HHV03811.1 glutamate--tRNA ligase [Bacteroidales bacterium]
MQTEKVRVRFAPSPTGPLHMGGVRTALFNYLFAKKHNGTFVLRIEDTDMQRYVPGAEQYITEALNWCGITPDEGVLPDGTIATEPCPHHPFAPYRQSERKDLYSQYARQLVSQGHAYYAFDTPEELESYRREAESRGETFIYNFAFRNRTANSLNMTAAEVAHRRKESNNWVIRFKIPENQTILMNDMIRGEVSVQSGTLDDKVLWKAHDGLPTYHLANIVDDCLMEITHVIRGEEWLPSLPLHYMLYDAFGWQEKRPMFAHLPLLLKPDGKGKLSKRDGDRLGFPVFPLEWTSTSGEKSRGYREDGYYPEAFINLIALLGWNPGTEQEIFTLEELIEAFSLDRVTRSGARFNPEKARWFNQQYLRTRSDTRLVQDFLPVLQKKGIATTPLKAEQVVSLIKHRASFVHEFWDLSYYFFIPPSDYDPSYYKKAWKPGTPGILRQARDILAGCAPFDIPSIDKALHQWMEKEQLKTGQVMNALRLCIVGKPQGPGMAEIMAVVGKEDTLVRLDQVLNKL